ncbi:thiolase family protein [Dactylosporangium sp. NPDC005572]|uniref:thiolase family protein n=1 Tax=Dactylosporangium sp. NPDC005572 TaxID=3156889 RepID=UPI0033BD678C
MNDPIGIIGVGQTPYRKRNPDRSAGELVRIAVTEALADARIELADIDFVVGGVAPDALSGIADIDKASISLPGKPYLHVNTGGATGSSALLAARTLIDAGRADVVLVVALERMGQATTAQSIFNTIFDPIYEKDFVLTTITMAALRATMLMSRHGFTGEHWAGIASRNFTQATHNPLVVGARPRTVQDVLDSPVLAWPIHLYEACPISEGACAVVLARGDLARSRETAWILGTGAYSDTYAMGDRMHRPEGSLIEMVPLRRAAEKAYREAGITEPLRQVDVLELQAPFAIIEAMAYPALGLCDLDDSRGFVERAIALDIPLTVNPSGGAQAANPVSATALVRIAEAALQVRHRAGDRQVPGARTALATGQGGATQFSTVCLLGSEAP